MEHLITAVKVLSAGGAAIATLYGGATFVDHRYAHHESVVQIEFRLEQKILTDRSSRLQQRIWQIEDRYGPDLQDAPDTVREEYRRIQAELADLEQEITSVQDEYRREGKSNSRYYEKSGKY